MVVASRDFRVEGHHFHHSIVMWVRIPPQTAFAYLADISRHNEWSTNRIRITPLTPGPIGLGSKYAAVGRQWSKDWPSELEVTGYEPPSDSSSPQQVVRLARQRAIHIGMSSC